ncbi:Hypothetical predicted protein [Olea europaea subsp. europaea]|uniref:Uncharacterized protein n=1 Tax=Olea europaea subsp. europaea TaxID=158383 RepID=A0A8S0TZH6_OLEEU|nr:Hypothetical predicted protein [Olea europaea subsp. europaea]
MIFYFLFLQCQSVDSLGVLPGGGTAKPEYESQLNIVRRMEDFNMMKSDVCLTTESNLENAKLKMDKPNSYAPCILDVDIEKGKSENTNPNDESVEHLKTNDCFAIKEIQAIHLLQFKESSSSVLNLLTKQMTSSLQGLLIKQEMRDDLKVDVKVHEENDK